MEVPARLIVDSISCVATEKRLLSAVSFFAARGEVVALLGANGAGKTTLLRSLAGLVASGVTGRIVIDGNTNLLGGVRAGARGSFVSSPLCWPGRLLRLSRYCSPQGEALPLAYVPDLDPLADCSVTVGDFIRYTAKTNGVGLVRAEESRDARFESIVALLCIEHLLSSLLATVSSGERQRILVAAALMDRPAVILLDEPSSFLDPKAAWEMWQVIHHVCRSESCTAICVTHDINMALNAAHRLLFLRNGCLIGDISPRDNQLGTILEQTFGAPFRVRREEHGALQAVLDIPPMVLGAPAVEEVRDTTGLA